MTRAIAAACTAAALAFALAAPARHHPRSAATRDAGPAPATRDAGAAACLDGWLAAHGLSETGDPAGAVYAGGDPLFDETTGKRTSREERLRALHPEAFAACADAGAPAR